LQGLLITWLCENGVLELVELLEQLSCPDSEAKGATGSIMLRKKEKRITKGSGRQFTRQSPAGRAVLTNRALSR